MIFSKKRPVKIVMLGAGGTGAHTLHHALQLEDYSYDYCWEDGTRDSKGPKIVLILYEEFDSYRELPESLFSILDFCETGIQHMEKELGISPVIPLEVPGPHDTKEAAR